MDYFGVRNAVLIVWRNVPMPYLMIHLAVVILRCGLTSDSLESRDRLLDWYVGRYLAFG